MTIHWCGTGLSAIPGLRQLITSGHDVIVWNRTIEKAISAVGDITNSIKEFDIQKLESQEGTYRKNIQNPCTTKIGMRQEFRGIPKNS